MILITGASGFLGQHLTCEFSKISEVYGLGNSNALGCRARVDLRDGKELLQTLNEVQPQTIIHAAALRDPDVCLERPEDAQKIHVDATKIMAEWCKKKKARLVYISTDYVFDGKNPPYNEESQPNPVNLYGATKLAGEKEAKNCPNHLITRISLQYGTTKRPELSFIHKAVKKLRSGEKVEFDNVQCRFPSLSSDVAKALVELEARNYQGLLHMSNNKAITRYEMWRQIALAFNCDPALVIDTGKPPAQTASRPVDCTFDISRYLSLGLPRFHTFEEGLRLIRDDVLATL